MNLAAAIRRFPVLVVLPVVVFTAAGITLGLRRHPTYTASSEINVGIPDVSAQATPGYVVAAQSLASAYSRQVNGIDIYRLVARRRRLPVATVEARLSSSAVPSGSTFFINGSGPSVSSAIGLTKAATAALQQTINVLQQGVGASPALLNRYRLLQSNADQLADRLTMLQKQRAAGTATATTAGTAAEVSEAQVRQANVDAQVAELQAQALAGQYTQSATTSRGAVIQVLNPPTGASNDRRSVTERYGLIGLVAGLVMGAVFALMVAGLRERQERRTLAAPLESAPSN
jgi:hypothetical protein